MGTRSGGGMSWVIVHRATGSAVMELFNQGSVDEALSAYGSKIKALPAGEYLGIFNKAVREAGGVQPSPEALARAFA